MKSTIRFILAFLIINLTFVREGAALESGDSATPLFLQSFSVAGEEDMPRGLTFSNDGTKMFVIGEQNGNGGTSGSGEDDMHEYTLSTPFDISTASYVDSLANLGDAFETSIKFNNDGSKMFVLGKNRDYVQEYSLTANFDLSSANFVRFFRVQSQDNNIYGLDFNNDGTMMYITGHQNDSIHQYELAVGFDLSDVTFLRSQDLSTQSITPSNIEFNTDGTRMFIIGTSEKTVNQYDLSTGFDISTLSHVGFLDLSSEAFPYGLAFSPSGLKMFITGSSKKVSEYTLNCPFTLFSGNCPSITENSIRTGIAIAQIEVATRTIEQSTDTALNRLKWIRRNKDNQNLTNLNLDLNFTNPMLVSLAKVVKNSATSKKTKEQEQEQDIFFWSEGSIAVGRVGETKASSFKKIKTDAITVGADKFTKNNGIRGLAFRFGKDDVEVGTVGSNLDANTYNLTHYTSSPIKDDTKFIDTVIGVGALNFDILSVFDGERVTAKRDGKQIYGTIKLKDEIKKNNLTLVPSGQIDLGYTLLNKYQESGNAAMKFKKQGVQSRNARLSIAAAEELENEKYKIRKHGKLEYKANLHRSSSIKYSYLADTTGDFDTKLYSGALHNLNGELGVDIILPDSFSIFLIYERNQALGVGHTDKINLAIGFLPNKKTNYAYKLAGSEHLGSEFKISKKINDFEIDFTLNNQDALRPNTIEEAMLSLRQIF
ncbi:autotransporter outer membrane beta-barrel domain-containing protein [Candidatus Pelagibacter sp. IMCC9063]|uniref:autotransporter outer membrane beta-barrel domain-containing protein n=1 Tax=Pelagibacter sp. (strain IMCC9063) TaxID=1002672 RepID=UPI0011D16C70|nr:autotransporter outer membrane beta-barrel domain-containing protein [Candidatus Pelagibacter sp. IMCC9063]